MRDEDLRAFGFAVIARPPCGEALWRHCVCGMVMGASDAIRFVDSQSPQALRLQHEADLQRERRGR